MDAQNVLYVYDSQVVYAIAGGAQRTLASNIGSGYCYLAVTPDGSTLFVSDRNSNALLRINTTSGAASTVASVPWPNGIGLGPQGFVYVATGDNRVIAIDPATGATVLTMQGSYLGEDLLQAWLHDASDVRFQDFGTPTTCGWMLMASSSSALVLALQSLHLKEFSFKLW